MIGPITSITIERLRELLSYDPDTGEFRWNKARQRCAAGGIAGSAYEARKYEPIPADREEERGG